MTELRQREPREKSKKYLDYIRSLPCCICGGIDTEAAHIRTSSLAHEKTHTGMGEKPSDIWVLPLCNRHHRAQHDTAEWAFWVSWDIDPHKKALALWAATGDHELGEQIVTSYDKSAIDGGSGG